MGMPESLSHALRELWNPSYQHLVLHPFFVHGLLLCGFFVLGSTVVKQTRASAMGLLLLALCALTVLPYLQARTADLPSLQATHSKFAATEISGLGDRLRSFSWIYYVLAGLAIVSLVATPAKASVGMILSLVTAILAIGVGVWGLDFHHRESRLYHPNLTEAPGVAVTTPPVPPSPVRQAPAAAPAKPVNPAPPVAPANPVPPVAPARPVNPPAGAKP